MNTDKDHILSELMLIRYRQGDVHALDELVRYWENRLFYYIMRLVSNEEDAWDALQETWFALVKNIHNFRESRSLVLWLYKTARNKSMDRLRKRYSDRSMSIDCEEMAEVEDPTEAFSIEDAEVVHKALENLPLHQREVLTLYFLEEMSIEEISKVVAIAVGTVKSRLHYAKKALQAILEEEGLSR